jgi:leucyl/phenylalanyl-tRNA--protein transferase
MAYHHLMTEWNKRGYYLVDCQVHNEHLESLGAVLIDRSEFLQRLRVELKFPTAPLK